MSLFARFAEELFDPEQQEYPWNAMPAPTNLIQHFWTYEIVFAIVVGPNELP
jgi:hypothetical protein